MEGSGKVWLSAEVWECPSTHRLQRRRLDGDVGKHGSLSLSQSVSSTASKNLSCVFSGRSTSQLLESNTLRSNISVCPYKWVTTSHTANVSSPLLPGHLVGTALCESTQGLPSLSMFTPPPTENFLLHTRTRLQTYTCQWQLLPTLIYSGEMSSLNHHQNANQ